MDTESILVGFVIGICFCAASAVAMLIARIVFV